MGDGSENAAARSSRELDISAALDTLHPAIHGAPPLVEISVHDATKPRDVGCKVQHYLSKNRICIAASHTRLIIVCSYYHHWYSHTHAQF